MFAFGLVAIEKKQLLFRYVGASSVVIYAWHEKSRRTHNRVFRSSRFSHDSYWRVHSHPRTMQRRFTCFQPNKIYNHMYMHAGKVLLRPIDFFRPPNLERAHIRENYYAKRMCMCDSHAAVIRFRARAATAFGARKWREKWICGMLFRIMYGNWAKSHRMWHIKHSILVLK